MPLYGVGFNEYQQLVVSTESTIYHPVRLSLDDKFPTKKLHNLVILWSKIIAIMTDGSVLMLHLRRLTDVQSDAVGFITKDNDNCMLLDDSFSTVSISLDDIITFNKRNKHLILWDGDFDNPQHLSCSHLERFSIENVHSTDDNKTIIFTTTSGISFKSMTSLDEARKTSSLVIEQFLFTPDRTLPIKVKQVSCGKHHSLVLTIIGVVFSFGNGNQGQLGNGAIESREEPSTVETLEGFFVSEVSAGGWHSIALTDSGEVYVWGWNNYGQLGLPSEHSNKEINSGAEVVNIQAYPVCLEIPDSLGKTMEVCDASTECDVLINQSQDDDCMSFVQISSGSRHSLALNSKGEVLSWGWNKYGQLGYHGVEVNDRPKKVEILSGEKVTRIFAGHWNSVFETQTI